MSAMFIYMPDYDFRAHAEVGAFAQTNVGAFVQANVGAFAQAAAEITAGTATAPDISDARLEKIIGIVAQTRLGREMLDWAKMQREYGGTDIIFRLDGQMENLGCMWNTIQLPKKFIRCGFLNAHMTDPALASIFVHELRHAMQQEIFSTSVPIILDNLAKKILQTRLREGDAFTVQTLHAIEHMRETGSPALLDFMKDYVRKKCAIPEETRVFSNLCTLYAAAQDPQAQRLAAQDIFWWIQNNILQSYDDTAIKRFDGRAQVTLGVMAEKKKSRPDEVFYAVASREPTEIGNSSSHDLRYESVSAFHPINLQVSTYAPTHIVMIRDEKDGNYMGLKFVNEDKTHKTIETLRNALPPKTKNALNARFSNLKAMEGQNGVTI